MAATPSQPYAPAARLRGVPRGPTPAHPVFRRWNRLAGDPACRRLCGTDGPPDEFGRKYAGLPRHAAGTAGTKDAVLLAHGRARTWAVATHGHPGAHHPQRARHATGHRRADR